MHGFDWTGQIHSGIAKQSIGVYKIRTGHHIPQVDFPYEDGCAQIVFQLRKEGVKESPAQVDVAAGNALAGG